MAPELTSEAKFAFEGFIPLGAILSLGIVLLGLSWWMARSDTRFSQRPRLVWVLLLLRAVAVLVLLWMLAGPTLVTAVRKFKRKSIAVLVDTSASMGLIDNPDGSGNVSRWAASREQSQDTEHLRQLDSAVAALRAIERQLQDFADLPDVGGDGPAARAHLAHAVQGISDALERIKRSTADPPGYATELKPLLADVVKTLESASLRPLQERVAMFSRGKSIAALEREHWLPAQREGFSVSVSTVERLADQLATSAEEVLGKSRHNLATQDLKSSRLEKVNAFLTTAENGWLKELGTRVAINRYEFGEKVIPVGPSPEQPQGNELPKKVLSPTTELGAALQQVALDNTTEALAAAILITDGCHNAGRDPRELASSLTASTLHIVPIGNLKMERDVILHHAHAPKAVLQNDTLITEATVTAYGCEKESLHVELLDAGKVVEQQTVGVTTGVFNHRVQLRWKASKIGKHNLVARVRPVEGERDEENNSAQADVQVMEENISVLVADNFPRWETRYILNLFKRDRRVTSDQLLFEPQRSAGEGLRSGFPVSLGEWSKYRVIILGDVLPSQLTLEHQKLLEQYVSEGGGNLVIVAGKDAMPAAYVNGPLGSLLPVQAGEALLPAGNPFYLHLADEASQALATQIAEDPLASQRIWREMSQRLPVYRLSQFSKPKPTAHSLIWAGLQKTDFDLRDPATRSFLSWQYVGAGRVVYLAAPVTYQLRYRQGDTFHHRFWGQLLRWVVARDLAEGSQTVRLSTDKLRYELGEPVQVSAQLRELDGKVVTGSVLQAEAWQRGTLRETVTLREDASRPGTYHAVLSRLPAGSVRLQLSGNGIAELLAAEHYSRQIETTFNVDPSAALELRDTLCNMPLLREIAEGSRGLVVPPTGLEAALRQLNLEPESSETITKKALWNRWDLLCLFLGCLTLEWAGRKYLGLS